MWNGTMFVDLDWLLNASSLLSASAELLVSSLMMWNLQSYPTTVWNERMWHFSGGGGETYSDPSYIFSRGVIANPVIYAPARAGSEVERIDPLRFLAGCRKSRLNQALSLLSLSIGFFSVSVYCAVNYCYFLHCVIVLCLSVVLDWIFWKDLSPKWPIMCWCGR